MKKIVLYILALSVILLLPMEGTDVAKLQPVEVIQIDKDKEESSVVITTDVGAAGTGATVERAIENLKATTSGIVFLDTADYLLLGRAALEEADKIKTYLKPSIRVCCTDEEIDLTDAAAFLAIHKPDTRLKEITSQYPMKNLVKENGRLILKEN